ncbi:uncharacterized protein LOC6566465 isoform X2 [Drosophila grimshawi]|uniref:uncharacterized protein LOC6566465 isoform X2 n=1 Tax=Drosophila grimshawi TaxID=7222 RepID=UPI001C934A43|nr:uncharacterized protein LOC6566465 isoform X2 [Drosophila grimshawi]
MHESYSNSKIINRHLPGAVCNYKRGMLISYLRLAMEVETTSLLILNDDCLDNIFVYFTLDELMLLFGSLHSLIDAAVERQLHRFRHFEFSMRFPPQYNEIQLQALGRHLQSLSVNVGYSVRSNSSVIGQMLHPLLVGAAAGEGGRLRALKIQHTYINSSYIKLISLVVHCLSELDLSRCDVDDTNEFMLLLRSATKLKALALYNEHAAVLEESLLSRLQLLKINWMVGTQLFDVAALNQKYPFLSIVVYQANQVDVYGPPAVGKIAYFRDI